MQTLKNIFISFVILSLTYAITLNAQTPSVRGDDTGFKVTMTGEVQRVSGNQSSNSTITYYLKNNSRQERKPIRIHSPYKKPQIGMKYKVTGILYSDSENGKPFISEKSRQIVTDNDEKISEKVNLNNRKQLGDNLLKITHNIHDYEKEFIEISGKVIKKYDNADWYRIKGQYGTKLDIQEYNNPPELNTEIKTSGILYLKNDGTPFLSVIPEMAINDTKVFQEATKAKDSIYLYVILGGIFVGGLIFAISTYVRKIKGEEKSEHSRKGEIAEEDVSVTYQEEQGLGGESKSKDTLTLSTPSKTAKILPGRLTVISDAPDKGQTFPLSGTPTAEGYTSKIGKSDDCEITIANRPEYDTVSREHAMFIAKDNDVWIKNLSETNPTIVNGEVLKEERKKLNDGDRIKLGLLELIFEISNAI